MSQVTAAQTLPPGVSSTDPRTLTKTGIATIERNYGICQKVVMQALASNSNFDKDDISFATPIICSGAKARPNLINFLLHAYLNCNTGRYSFTYNEYLVRAIKKRGGKTLTNLVNVASEAMFPELFDNPNISGQDKAAIKAIVDREYSAMYNAVEQAYKSKQPAEKIKLFNILPCTNRNLPGGLYQQCYTNICKKQVRLDQNKNPNCFAGAYNIDPPDTLQIPLGIDPDLELPSVQCVGYIDFIKYLAGSPHTTMPETIKTLTKAQLQELNQRYAVEVSMYQFYIDNIDRIKI